MGTGSSSSGIVLGGAGGPGQFASGGCLSGAAGPLSIASLGLSAASTITAGEGTQATDDFKAAQSQRSADYGQLKAVQTSGQLTEQLNTTLGNIGAIRAAAGTDPTSPTSIALNQRASFVGTRNNATTVDSILAQSQQDQADANYMKSAGDFALKSSYLKAGTDVAASVAKVALL